MKRVVVVALLMIGVIGSIYLVLFPISSPVSSLTNTIASSSSSLHPQIIHVVYLNGQEKNIKNNESNDSKTLFLQKKVKFATEDNRGKYEIVLVDENVADENITIQNGYKVVKGSINDSFFVLKVPKKSLESGELKLIVIDKQSHTQKEIDANFLRNLRTLESDQRVSLRLNFEDLSNYDLSLKKEQKILPVP